MYDFGNVNGHVNRISYGDINAMDANANYAFSMWIRLNLAPGANLACFGKWAAGNNGWVVQVTAGRRLQISHNDGVGWASAAATTAMAVGTTYHYVGVYDGGANACAFYRNGVLDGAPAMARGIAANATAVTIGETASAGGTGCACRLGHVMYWNVLLGANERTGIYAGAVPRMGSLIFWAPGWTIPGIEVMQNNVGPIGSVGVITYAEDAFQAWSTQLIPSGYMFPAAPAPPTPAFVLIN